MSFLPHGVVAAVASAALLVPVACSDETDRTPAADRSGEAASPTVDLSLTRSDPEAFEFAAPGGELAAVLPPGPDGQWLIAGHESDADGTGKPVVWRSGDGRSWSATDVDPGARGSFQVNDAVRHGDATVIVGEELEGRKVRGVVWVAEADGRFEQVHGSELEGEHTTVTNVVSGPGGLVASGSTGTAEDAHAVLWRSTDGRSWTEDDEAVRTMQEVREATVEGVAIRDRTVVAGGTVAADATTDAAIWLNTDGERWEPVASDSFTGPGEQAVNDVLFDGTSWLAVGHVERDGAMEPAVWRSSDARAWDLLDTTFPVGADRPTHTWGSTVETIAAVGGRLVALGGTRATPSIWWSTDAVTWTEQRLPENLWRSVDYHLGAIAVAGPDDAVAISGPTERRAVVVRIAPGSDVTEVTATSVDFPRAGPTGAVEGINDLGGRFVAWGERSVVGRGVGVSSDDARLWQSTDGTSWEAIDADPATEEAWIGQVTSWNGSALAVGAESFEGGPDRSGSPDPLVWIEDGGSWQRLPHGPTFPGLAEGDNGADMHGVLEVAGRLVAVGRGESGRGVFEAMAWTSLDGRTWTTVESDAFGSQLSSVAIDICPVAGGVVAVGLENQNASLPRTVAWSSTDGSAWTRAQVPVTPADRGETMVMCAPTSTGVVAGGVVRWPDGTRTAGMWSSTDGTTWTTVESEAFEGTDEWATGISADGDTVVAVGRDEGTGTGLVWASRTAGATWERLSLNADELGGEESVWFYDVHVRDGRVVVVGSVDDRPAIWTGSLP